MAETLPLIINSRYPNFFTAAGDWEKWRLTYRGGEEFRDRYLVKSDLREDPDDFRCRKAMTPIPTFAKAALNDIRNAIFQRLADVVRRDGSPTYQAAINGEQGGVDLRDSTMNYFLGNKILTELMTMGKVGIYVDAPEIKGASLADAVGKRPYLYHYNTEDILNYACNRPEDPSEFSSILLRDTLMKYDERTWLPLDYTDRYRLVWIDKDTGLVNIQFYDNKGVETDRDGLPGGGPIELQINRIPFVMLDIGDSLLKDVAQYQIALLNLVSMDVNYALKANFPFYTEQRDGRGAGQHLKRTATDGTASTGGQGASDETMTVGVTRGRYYDKDTDRPDFIAPPSEPLMASLKLQEKLESDIRKLVNLAVQSLASRASAESKSMDNQGLEAGLSFIGLVLEGGERRVADFWASYEERTPSRRTVAVIKYPERYSLKSDVERIEEAKKLIELMNTLPGRTVKREIAKQIVTVLFAGKIKADKLQNILDEIDRAKYTSSDLELVKLAKEAGLAGDQTLSIALGFDDNEYLKGQEDHIRRATAIAEMQASLKPEPSDPAARGVKDLSADPAHAAKDEKAASRDTTLNDTTKVPVRGEGK